MDAEKQATGKTSRYNQGGGGINLGSLFWLSVRTSIESVLFIGY